MIFLTSESNLAKNQIYKYANFKIQEIYKNIEFSGIKADIFVIDKI
jgi:hypothetical protein